MVISYPITEFTGLNDWVDCDNNLKDMEPAAAREKWLIGKFSDILNNWGI